MSLDFSAYFDIGPGFRGAEHLLAELALEPPPIRAVVERYWTRWRVQDWGLSDDPIDESRPAQKILGPGGFSLLIRRRAVMLYHVLRFSGFIHGEEERNLLRSACFNIATRLGSTHAIYAHELYPVSFFEGPVGPNLREMEADLRDRFGPPALTIQAL